MSRSTGAFFEFLDAQALTPTTMRKTLSKWDSERIDQFLAEARQRVPYVRTAAASRFSFVANSTLSGLPEPCSEMECRLTNLASMARFAALYADQVLVHDPFVERAYPPARVNTARKRLADDLMVVYQIRPLLEAGIAGVAYRSFNICPIHGTHIVDEQDDLRARLATAREALLHRLSKETQTYFNRRSGYVLVNGPETLIDHGGRALQWVGEFPPKLGRRRNPPKGDRSIIGESRADLLYAVAQPAIRDALVQSIYGTLYGHSYLTNRSLDVDLARAVNSNQTNIVANSLLSGFEHSLPFLQQLSLQDALTLRSAEGMPSSSIVKR